MLKTPQLRRILRKDFLILIILTLLLYREFFLCTITVKADSTANTTILGYNIQIYFISNPGVITSQPTTAVINIEGDFTGYFFVEEHEVDSIGVNQDQTNYNLVEKVENKFGSE